VSEAARSALRMPSFQIRNNFPAMMVFREKKGRSEQQGA